MAVEPSLGSPVAPPSTNRVKSAGNRAVGSPASESGNGVNCHQCRQKTRDFAAACDNMRKNKPCMVKLCRKCLLNRYGEKVEDVVNLEKWICPKCRGICNCSVCMKRKGHEPTGQLSNTAKATGFSSVTEMLKSAECLNHEYGGSGRNGSLENGVALSSRKRGKENSFDGQLGSKLSKGAGKKAKKVKGEHNINGDDNKRPDVTSNGAGLCNGENKPKRMKTNNTVHKEIVLPLGTDLTSVAGIDVPAEDVGNALEFLEFCSVFKKILEMKNGEAEYLLQEILHGLSTKQGKRCPIVQFHMHLLSILKTERGEKFAKSSGSNGKGSWFDVLKICLAESPRVLKSSRVASLEKATDYEALNASEKLRVMNLLCIEVLGMRKLRNWIENQNTQHERKAKEAKQKFLDASSKVKALKQKAKDDVAKAIESKDGEQEAQQARAELLESKEMLSKIDQTAHAVRIEPVFADYSGHMYWKLNCGGESEVLHQYVGKGDTLTLNEKWSALSAEEKEVIEKNISARQK